MSKTIVQDIVFPASAARLYKLYVDSRLHCESTGGQAKITAKAGGAMSAWDGYIKGKFLQLRPNRLIVQTWRASDWPKSAPDSILTLIFEDNEKGCAVHMSHAGVPNDAAAGLTKGWREFYWNPWKKYLGG